MFGDLVSVKFKSRWRIVGNALYLVCPTLVIYMVVGFAP
jgi:hypothetical protein